MTTQFNGIRRLPFSEHGTSAEPFAPRAFRIPDVCKTSGLGRTTIYAAIKSGELAARKYGRATIVLADDLEIFLRSLPATNRA
jgi:hypothetical protein